MQNHQEDEQRHQDDKNSTVEKWLGQERFDILLRLSRAQNEQQLAPIWNRLANTKKASWTSTVQAAYDSVKESLNEPHLTMVADTAMVNTTISLAWYLTTKDAIDTGINILLDLAKRI
mgnify:CR=1 FL=1